MRLPFSNGGSIFLPPLQGGGNTFWPAAVRSHIKFNPWQKSSHNNTMFLNSKGLAAYFLLRISMLDLNSTDCYQNQIEPSYWLDYQSVNELAFFSARGLKCHICRTFVLLFLLTMMKHDETCKVINDK